jgi:5'-3' exonuclease
MRKVLIVDAWNVFIAGFKASDKVSLTGKPIGGALFLLRTISKIANHFNVNRIDIVWETNGSPARRKIHKGYKSGRSPSKFRANRSYQESENDMHDNWLWQIEWSTKILGYAGCGLYNVPTAEADDIISHLSRYTYRYDQVIILSSDNDMWQMLDGDRVICMTASEKIMNESTLIAEYGVHPSNWALAKSFIGDTSDNIPGLDGVGYKKLLKLTSLLKPNITIGEVLSNAKELDPKNKLKWVNEITDPKNRFMIENNLKLINLHSLNNTQTQTLRRQHELDRESLMDQVYWMQETFKEGVPDAFELWNGVALVGAMGRRK